MGPTQLLVSLVCALRAPFEMPSRDPFEKFHSLPLVGWRHLLPSSWRRDVRTRVRDRLNGAVGIFKSLCRGTVGPVMSEGADGKSWKGLTHLEKDLGERVRGR